MTLAGSNPAHDRKNTETSTASPQEIIESAASSVTSALEIAVRNFFKGVGLPVPFPVTF
jgi:hypothetical protein